MKQMKRVVARYSLDSGITSNCLVDEILKTFVTLIRRGLIVNNIVGDGASDSRSVMKSLGTLSIEDNDNLRRLLPMDIKLLFLIYYVVIY